MVYFTFEGQWVMWHRITVMSVQFMCLCGRVHPAYQWKVWGYSNRHKQFQEDAGSVHERNNTYKHMLEGTWCQMCIELALEDA